MGEGAGDDFFWFSYWSAAQPWGMVEEHFLKVSLQRYEVLGSGLYRYHNPTLGGSQISSFSHPSGKVKAKASEYNQNQTNLIDMFQLVLALVARSCVCLVGEQPFFFFYLEK